MNLPPIPREPCDNPAPHLEHIDPDRGYQALCEGRDQHLVVWDSETLGWRVLDRSQASR